MKKHHPPPIGDARLNRHARRAQESARNAELLAELARESNTKLARPIHQVDAADERTLRGIPAIGRGVAGVSPGTRPDAICNR